MDAPLQQAKNALVASLFELSNAATEAATATVNFYKAAGFDGSESASGSLKNLSASIADAALLATKTIANGTAEPKKVVRKKKAVPETDAAPTEPAAAPKAKATKAAAKTAAPTEAEPEKPAESETAAPEPVADPATVQLPSQAAAPEKAEKVEKEKAVRKRRVTEKDPNAPKKPLTSYLRFNVAVRDDLRKQRIENGQPTFQATELNQIIAVKWANLSEEEKLNLQKEYETEFEQYKILAEEYRLKKLAEGGASGDAAAAAPADAPAAAAPAAPKTPKTPKTTKKAAIAATPASPIAVTAPTTPATPSVDPLIAGLPAKTKKKISKPTLSSVEKAATEVPADAAKVDSPAKKTKKRKEKDGEEKKPKKKKIAEPAA